MNLAEKAQQSEIYLFEELAKIGSRRTTADAYVLGPDLVLPQLAGVNHAIRCRYLPYTIAYKYRKW